MNELLNMVSKSLTFFLQMRKNSILSLSFLFIKFKLNTR